MFSKAQLIERIRSTTKLGETNMQKLVEDANQLDDPEIQVLVEAIAMTGACITDALTNLTLVLCETLPGKEV